MGITPHNINDDDRALVKQYIVLPLVLTAFERDASIITSVLKTPEPYVERIRLAMDTLTHDITDLKRQLRDRGIKVYEQTHDGDGVYAKFQCRGYHGNMTLRWSFLNPEAAIIMRKYLGVDTSGLERTL